MAKKLHFYSKQIDHAILRDFLLDFQMEFRVTRSKHFKVVKRNWLVTNQLWFLTAVDFFDLDRLFVKGEIPTLTLK